MTDEQAVPETPSVAPSKLKPSRPLPTNRIAFSKQLDILRGYAALYAANSKPVATSEVSALLKLHPETIRLTHPFFLDQGLLGKQKGEIGFVPNADALAYHRAFQWNEETAATKLYPSLAGTWAAKSLTTVLGFRGTLPKTEAIQLLADASTSPPSFRPSLEVLLSYLDASGVVRYDGSVVNQGEANQDQPPPPKPKEEKTQGDSSERTGETPQYTQQVGLPRAGGTLTLSGDINVFKLIGDERDLVFKLIDTMAEFLAKQEEPK